MHPTISIITPSFNQGKFIEESILSVISQEGEFSIDYVLVDGGSTDNSLEIIKKYDTLLREGAWPVKCRGVRYRWLSGPDNGQSDAVNKGFRMAEGDIAAWLNSDDFYKPGAFAAAVRAFQKDEGLAMIYGDGEIVDRDGRPQMMYDVEPFFDLWKLIHLYDFILQPSVFMRREALNRAGYLNGQLHYIMDWDLWIRLSRFGKIRHLPETLSCSRVYPEAKTQASGMKRWREIQQCSHRYGHMKWPPVTVTQLFHRPVNVVLGSGHERERRVFSSFVRPLKKAYYALIGGNRSGIYGDGHAERTAFLSIPLRPGTAKALLRIKPLCPNRLRYFVNNGYSGALALGSDAETIEVAVAGETEGRDFLHIKFISEKDTEIAPLPMTSAKRKVSFRLRYILLQSEDGKIISDLAVPEFIDAG